MFEDFNIKLVIYVIMCIFILTWGTNQILQNYQMLGAIVYFVGALGVCIIYGIRWFDKKDSSNTTVWPPVINTCPDYLTYFDRQQNGKSVPTCIDTIGVSKNNGITLFPKDGDSNSNESCFFSLVTTTNNKNAELCKRAIDAGLTWEGITNGESCDTNNSSNSNSNSNSGDNTCISK